MINRSSMRGLGMACLALGALLVLSGLAWGDVPAQRALYADVKGKVVDDATGAPVAGVAVSLLYETVVTNEQGEFLFQKIPMLHTAEVSLQVSTEEGIIIGCTTFDVPVRYYPVGAADGDRVAVTVVEPGADADIELRLKAVTIDEVDDYCATCHGGNPCVERASFEEVVASGKELKGIVVKESELERFRDQLMKQGVVRESYQKIRYQDTHPDNVNMNQIVSKIGPYADQFRQPDQLRLHEYKEGDTEYRVVVCDTCHSRHIATPQRQYVVMPFDEDSELCYQCHK